MSTPQPPPYDWAAFYAEHPLPRLADVNGMSLPEAFAWYRRNGFNVHPVQVTEDGDRRLARPGDYSFDTLLPPTPDETAWLAANWKPGWLIGWIMSKGSGHFALDVDDMAQWVEFNAELGNDVSLTAVEQTGSGKLHLVYAWPHKAPEQALRQGGWSDKYPRIEVISKRFIVVAPSPHHKTGQPNQWLENYPQQPQEPAEALTARRVVTALDEAISRKRAEIYIAREASRREDAQEEALARGGRMDMSWADLTKLPKPVWIYQRLLTVGWHGLAGPPEAGKSLLAREWLCEIAASGRNVVYVLSEGQFDLEDRFRAHPQIQAASPHLFFLDGGLNLASGSDVAWLCEHYRKREPALIVLDMIYGFGLPDDNGVQGVAPVINGGKKIAADLSCAVLAVGHPGLSGERRFRGSSMWRGSFDTEWHMADGQFSCEKHKYADRRALSWQYQVEWPGLRLLGEHEQMDRTSARLNVIAEDFATYPKGTDAERARRVSARLGVGAERARTLIRAWKNSQI